MNETSLKIYKESIYKTFKQSEKVTLTDSTCQKQNSYADILSLAQFCIIIPVSWL